MNIKRLDSGSALTSNGDVTLTLKGDNHLTGGNGDTYGGDGIYQQRQPHHFRRYGHCHRRQ
ncbi:MAG: hypothetical protein ACLTGJ_09390 [Faecalibacterium prausnitzii]